MATPLSTLERGVNGLKLEDVSKDTCAISARLEFNSGPETDPLVPPIYHTSTYRLNSVDDYIKILNEGGYIYSTLGNITCDAVQATINAIEGGKGTMIFNSGMAAISTAFFCFLESGDHIIVNNPVYSGVYDMVVNMFPKFKIEHTFVPAGCPVEEYKIHIKENTKLLYGETPCNPNMAILDLEEFGKLGRAYNILTMVDSTFASPYLQSASKYGLIYPCIVGNTKYVGGHNDLTAGSLTFSSVELWQAMIRYQTTLGSSLSPQEASLLLRGIKTLPIRMERHSSNGMKIAQYLEKHPKIEKIMYPGLPSHPQHDIAKKQMKSFGGMMAVEVKGGLKGGRILAENLRIVQLAVSLGGVESLIQHPATMTHGPMLMSDKDRRSGGITDGMVRISIGLEEPDDLIADFKQALDKIPEDIL